MVNVAHLQTLARKRCASGALFLEDGQVLLVKPSYKGGWGIPGGNVDTLESPIDACMRECLEELGIEVELDYLAIVDWVEEPAPGGFDSFQIIFIGKPLNDRQKQAITLPADELLEWGYFTFEDALQLLSPRVAPRVKIIFEHLDIRQTLYAENGVKKF